MKTTAILFAAIIAGCATGNPGPEIVGSTPHTITIDWASSRTGPTGTVEIAEAHCQQHGKHAQYAGKPTGFPAAYKCN